MGDANGEVVVETQVAEIAETAPNATILVPLYIYPLTEKTWQPLYEAIADNPNHDFLVVVNPNSGPGGYPLPSHDYLREVPKLNKYPNVRTVGYMKIDWCRRPLSESFKDIEAYAGWSSSGQPGLYVEGIFVDETPNHFSEEHAEYLHVIRKYIRALSGILGDRTIVENPGTPPDKGLAWYSECGPDVIMTSEEPYERFIGDEVQHRLKEYHYNQPQSGYMISAVPRDGVKQFVRELRHRGAYLFATDTVDDFYESFGDSWLDFISAMNRE